MERGLANTGREVLLFSGIACHNLRDTVSQMEAQMLFPSSYRRAETSQNIGLFRAPSFLNSFDLTGFYLPLPDLLMGLPDNLTRRWVKSAPSLGRPALLPTSYLCPFGHD